MRKLMRVAFGRRGVVAAALLLAAAGCGGAEERLPAVAPLTAPRGPGYMRRMLLERSHALQSLDAEVRMAIRNPQIPGQFNQVTFRRGRLVFEAPASAHLRVPSSGPARIEIAGNGDAYRVEMAQFRDSYTGRYGDPLSPRPGRILFLPEEIVYALNPAILMEDTIPVPLHHERWSYLYMLTRVTRPEPSYAFRASAWTDRETDRLLALQVFGENGTMRSRIRYGRVDTVPDAEERSVQVPTDIWISYPADETNIRLQLDDVTVNGELEEDLFRLGPAPANATGEPDREGP